MIGCEAPNRSASNDYPIGGVTAKGVGPKSLWVGENPLNRNDRPLIPKGEEIV